MQEGNGSGFVPLSRFKRLIAVLVIAGYWLAFFLSANNANFMRSLAVASVNMGWYSVSKPVTTQGCVWNGSFTYCGK